jgi:hypothetical protein
MGGGGGYEKQSAVMQKFSHHSTTIVGRIRTNIITGMVTDIMQHQEQYKILVNNMKQQLNQELLLYENYLCWAILVNLWM